MYNARKFVKLAIQLDALVKLAIQLDALKKRFKLFFYIVLTH